jgi:predicted transposase YdaD
LDICEEGAFTDAELALYDGYWDAIRVETSLISEGWREGEAKGEAKGKAEGLAEGEAKGKAEGKAEGLAEGEAKGRAEGLAEGEAKGEAKGRAEGIAEGRAESLINVVMNCRHNGFQAEQIQAITGLDEERILEIFRSGTSKKI